MQSILHSIPYLSQYSTNPIFMGIIGIYGLAVITFIFRSVPEKIFNFVIKQITTHVVLFNTDEAYFAFLKWVSEHKRHLWVRNFTVGEHGSSLNIGFGTIWFIYKSRLMFMERSKIENNNTLGRKEEIKLSVVGRDQSIFLDLFQHIIPDQDGESLYTRILNFKVDMGWYVLCRSYKRPLESIFIEKSKLDAITDHIDNFINNKEWFRKNGIPYRTGIVLYGPPGTGKTSLIKALCAKYDKNLYNINLASVNDDMFRAALADVLEHSIVAIEDIDVFDVKVKRKNDSIDKRDPVSDNQLTLSGILNAIDGAASGEGRILIITTNDINALDSALLREGRFDLKVEIGYMSQESYISYLEKFYPGYNFKNVAVMPNLTPAKLQKLIFENRYNPEKVIKETSLGSFNKQKEESYEAFN